MVAQPEILLFHAERKEPFLAEFSPVIKPLQLCARPAEELQLHLLEFAGAESEIARSDLIAEGLADLANAEGQFFPRRAGDILEIDEDALRRFRSEIDRGSGIFVDALEGLEHQIELADIRKVALAAGQGILFSLMYATI